MNCSSREELLQSITETISDYRKDEIPPIDKNHVDKWVDQFEANEQLIILKEMEHLLKKYYLSRQKARKIISEFLNSLVTKSIKHNLGSNPAAALDKIQFLHIQNKGNSQKELLLLVDEVLQEKYGICINKCGKNPEIYIYMDDCLFSGQTAFYDIKDRYLPQANEGHLYLIFFAAHQNGISYYIDKKLKEEIKKSPKEIIQGLKILNEDWQFNNNRWDRDKFDCFWNHELKDESDEYVKKYVQDLHSVDEERKENGKNTPPIFRPDGVPKKETIFSSESNRQVIETAFLKAGADIISLSQNPNQKMRPLGYDFFDSLGFGAMFITYRNIANNCPLALWWGDPSYPEDHPFSKWYPLFPRKSNEETHYSGIIDKYC